MMRLTAAAVSGPEVGTLVSIGGAPMEGAVDATPSSSASHSRACSRSSSGVAMVCTSHSFGANRLGRPGYAKKATGARDPTRIKWRTSFMNANAVSTGRSEEHTSELQSRENLVCRLLHDRPTPPPCPLSLHDALPIFRQPLQSMFQVFLGSRHGVHLTLVWRQQTGPARVREESNRGT